MSEKGWRAPQAEVQNAIAGLLQMMTEEHLPLSVRVAAGDAATAIVDAWIASGTCDEWAAQRNGYAMAASSLQKMVDPYEAAAKIRKTPGGSTTPEDAEDGNG